MFVGSVCLSDRGGLLFVVYVVLYRVWILYRVVLCRIVSYPYLYLCICVSSPRLLASYLSPLYFVFVFVIVFRIYICSSYSYSYWALPSSRLLASVKTIGYLPRHTIVYACMHNMPGTELAGIVMQVFESLGWELRDNFGVLARSHGHWCTTGTAGTRDEE